MREYFWLLLLGVFFMANASASAFTLESAEISEGEKIPYAYTCEGGDISPSLTWSNPPEKTQSFTLIFSDPDAPDGTWYHWVLYNIPVQDNALNEDGSLPGNTMVGKNSWGKSEYGGPCPPKGSSHRYIFTLYALDSTIPLPPEAEAKAVLTAMEGHILGTASLTSEFSR